MVHSRANAIAGALAAAFLIPIAATAAGHARTGTGLRSRATAFVHELAKGEFKTAETDFTGRMKRAVAPKKLRRAWQSVSRRFGGFQKTGIAKTVVQDGYTTVIVAADFKTRTLGIAVSFDSADKIAGVHFVPAP